MGGVLPEYITNQVKDLSTLISPDNIHKIDTTKGKKDTNKVKKDLNNDKVIKVSPDNRHTIDTTKGKKETNNASKTGEKT